MAEAWYEDWFDSPLYELLYANRDEQEAARLVSLLEDLIPPEDYPAVLDLGCGRGRHAFNMAQRGYHVTGIDLSELAVEKARKRAGELGLSNVSFCIRDMRHPLVRHFDAVVNLFTTFGYFDSDRENEKVIESAAEMLKEDGILFIDYLNPNVVRSNLNPRENGTIDGLAYEIERYIKNGAIFKEIEFHDSSGHTACYMERVKLYDLPWFKEVFESQNLKLVRTFGDYNGTVFDREHSPRLMMMAQLTDK